MPIKRALEDGHDTTRPKKRPRTSQDTGKTPFENQAPHLDQLTIRGNDFSSFSSTDIHSQLPKDSTCIEPKSPVPQQTQPLKLTREALQLLDDANRVPGDPSMASASGASGPSETSDGSINAYDPEFEPALNDRNVFFFRGKPDDLPNGLDELRRAVFAQEGVAKPPQGQAALVRRLLDKIRGEPDMVSRVMPEIVPFKKLEMDESAEVAVNQQWRRCLALDPECKPLLTTPKPDMTIGWNADTFRFLRASKNLRSFQSPVPSNNNLSWPLFTVEIKGEGGCMRHARLQNLHNAAIMLTNLRELMKAALKEADFFNKVHVLSLELTVESIQLSYYSATRSKTGEVEYYGKTLENWGMKSERDIAFNEAYHCVHNAIDFVRIQAYPLVHSCMESVEKLFSAIPTRQVPSPRSMSKQRIRKNSSTDTSSKKPTVQIGHHHWETLAVHLKVTMPDFQQLSFLTHIHRNREESLEPLVFGSSIFSRLVLAQPLFLCVPVVPFHGT